MDNFEFYIVDEMGNSFYEQFTSLSKEHAYQQATLKYQWNDGYSVYVKTWLSENL